jgi:hypothetical protein
VLLRLAESPHEEAQVHAARAISTLRGPGFLPALLGMLAQRDARAEARAALLCYGPEGLAFLDEALADRALPIELRRHLPRTIGLFPPAQAAAVLERHLLEEASGAVRYRILRALNRIAAAPDVALDAGRLRRGASATVEAIFRVIHWRLVLEQGALGEPRLRTPGHDLLVSLLRDKEAQSLERLLRLLALAHRREDFKGISRGLRSADGRARASSRELLENLLEPPLRAGVLAIVDEAPDALRLARSEGCYERVALDYDGVLALMLEQGGESLRCLAAYHVGELRLVALRPRLERLRGDGASFFLSRVVERTLGALADGDERLARA